MQGVIYAKQKKAIYRVRGQAKGDGNRSGSI